MSLSTHSAYVSMARDPYTDDEVDQLDSDLDGDDELQEGSSSASTSKIRRGGGERAPGRSLIAETRVESMLRADGNIGHMSKEALYVICIAAEDFIKRLAGASQEEAGVENRSLVDYRDVAAITRQYPEFDVLKDTIPVPLTLAQALERRAAKEKELLEDDPAISAPEPPQTTFVPSSGIAINARLRTRTRPSNGKERANGTSSVGAISTRRQRDMKGRWSNSSSRSGDGDHEPEEERSASANGIRSSSRTSRSARNGDQGYSISANGALPSQNGARSPRAIAAEHAAWAMPPPAVPSAHHLVDPLGPHDPLRPDDRWVSHYTGPASAFLEDHRMIFTGRNGMTDNPGRTIYSQQRPPNR